MSWRLAHGLETLRSQVDHQFPTRSKASDGTIGDAAHAARASDHNPVAGIVHAWDVTHDPPTFDAHAWAREVLVPGRDSRIKYVISNGQVWDPARGWHAYHGQNPHNHHVHVSVVEDGGDDPRPWVLDAAKPFLVTAGVHLVPGAFRNPQGLTYVPLRSLAEALGCTVAFDASTNTVVVSKV